MSRDDDGAQSGPLGNANPDRRGRGSGSGPNYNVDRKGRPVSDPAKNPPGKGKNK